MGRVTQDVAMIHGWEAPEDARRPVLLLGRVLGALVVLVALGVSAPIIKRILRPPTPTQPQTALPSRSTIPGTAALPDAGTSTARINAPETAPRSTRAPSSIPSAPRPAITSTSVDTLADRQTTSTSTRPVVSAPARLFVSASPWGQLYVDDTLVGNTPKANIELSPGEHVVRIVRTGFVSFERVLTAQSGDTLRLTDIVLVPSRP
jgi:hypothetical protein